MLKRHPVIVAAAFYAPCTVAEHKLMPHCPTGWKLTQSRLQTVCYGENQTDSPSLHGRFDEMSCGLEIEVRQCTSETMKGVLIGPLVNKVGRWTNIAMDLRGLLKEGDRITEFIGDGIDTNGNVVTYPPIHIHHLHILYPKTNHWFETHGDYKINQESGGYATKIPDGHCVVAGPAVDVSSARESSFKLQTQLNDVRYAQIGGGMGDVERDESPAAEWNATDIANAPEFEWYVRIVFKIKPKSEGSCQQVGKMVTFWPKTEYAYKDPLERYDVGNVRRVQWWTLRMQQNGQFVADAAWIHSHRARYGGMILVAGKHQLHDLTGVDASCATTAEDCPSQAEVHQLLINKAGEKVICSDDPAVKFWEELPFAADGTGGYYSRRGSFSCKPYQFVQNEILTLFSFDTPNWSLDAKHFPQHTMIFAFYTVDKASNISVATSAGQHAMSNSDKQYVMQCGPNSYGMWEPSSATYEEGISAYYPLDPDFFTEAEIFGIKPSPALDVILHTPQARPVFIPHYANGIKYYRFMYPWDDPSYNGHPDKSQPPAADEIDETQPNISTSNLSSKTILRLKPATETVRQIEYHKSMKVQKALTHFRTIGSAMVVVILLAVVTQKRLWRSDDNYTGFEQQVHRHSSLEIIA